MSVSDFPDWQGASRLPGYMVLGAFEQKDRFYLVPSMASVPEQSKGKPGFFFSPVFDDNETDPDRALYWMIHLQLQLADTLDAASLAMEQQRPGATLSPLSYAPRAYWSLEASQLDEPIVNEFAWERADETLIYQRLPQATGSILYHGLAMGALAATFAIQYEVVAMSSRFPMTVTLDPHDVLASLRAAGGDSSSISRPILLAYLAEHWRELFQTTDAPPNNDERDALALALAARVRMILGAFAPSSRASAGPSVGLLADEDVPGGQMRWDLRTPILEARSFLATCDPFTAARALIKEEGMDAITFPERIPPLPSNQLRERVRVMPLLPAHIANVIEANVDFRIERQYQSPNHIDLPTFHLLPEPDTAPVVLDFASPDKKIYQYRTAIVTTSDVYQTELSNHRGDLLDININSFDARFVILSAQPSLFSQATLEIAMGDASAVMNAAHPTASFVLPRVNTADDYGSFVVTARELDGDRHVEATLRTVSTTLTASIFPTSRPQEVEIAVTFRSPNSALVLRIEPEGTSQPETCVLYPDNAHRVFGYMCAGLFDFRYRYSIKGADGSWGPWSGYLDPARKLALEC